MEIIYTKNEEYNGRMTEAIKVSTKNDLTIVQLYEDSKWSELGSFSEDSKDIINYAYTSGIQTDNLCITGNTATSIDIGTVRTNHPSFSKLIVGEKVTTIKDTNPSFSSTLATVDLSNAKALTTLDTNAFQTAQLTSLELPDTVTTIKSYVFASIKTLDTLVIPDSVTSIAGSIAYHSTIKHIVLPNNANTVIASSALMYSDGLLDITLPADTPITTSLFCADCSALKEATIYTTNWTGTYTFYEDTSLEKVTIKEGVTTIPESTFSGCTNLTSAEIANTVTTIGSNAFYKCSSLEVTIPDSVTTIGDYAFNNVKHIYYNGSATGSPWGAKAIN